MHAHTCTQTHIYIYTHTEPRKLTAEIYVKKLQNLNFDVKE